ncbi:sigma-70 family RNA polymerase sigma factor [Hymenobacter daeguensis]
MVNGFPLIANKTYSAKALRDFELIRRIIGFQDEKAYQEIWDSYQKPIRRLVQRFVSQTDAAQDLTLEIFVRAFKYLPRFKPTFAFSTWLFRVATNCCLAFLERRRLPTVSLHAPQGSGEETFTLDCPDPTPLPCEIVMQAQRAERLQQAIKALPLKYYQLVQLHYFYELSYEEIAQRQRVPVGTVKAGLHRSRRLLQRAMQGEMHRI